MKKILALAIALALLLAVSVSVASAGTGDPNPGIVYWPDTYCGITAGDFGFFSTTEWQFAVYPNGKGILKCITHLGAGQTPPADYYFTTGFSCGTPAGSTTDAWSVVEPDGKVVLVCRVG